MSCPLARPVRELTVSSDYLSSFLSHLGLLPLCACSLRTVISGTWALGFCIQRHLFPLLFRALPLSPPLPLSPFANRPLSTLESAWFTGVWEMTLAGCRTVQKQGRGQPGVQRLLFGPSLCFQGRGRVEWRQYLVSQCFLSNFEQWLQSLATLDLASFRLASVR